jgi:hypothetical protein
MKGQDNLWRVQSTTGKAIPPSPPNMALPSLKICEQKFPATPCLDLLYLQYTATNGGEPRVAPYRSLTVLSIAQ